MDQPSKPSFLQQKKQEFRSLYDQGLSLLDISQKLGVTTPILAQWAQEIKKERIQIAAAREAADPSLIPIDKISVMDDVLHVVFKLLPGIIIWILLLKLIRLL